MLSSHLFVVLPLYHLLRIPTTPYKQSKAKNPLNVMTKAFFFLLFVNWENIFFSGGTQTHAKRSSTFLPAPQMLHTASYVCLTIEIFMHLCLSIAFLRLFTERMWERIDEFVLLLFIRPKMEDLLLSTIEYLSSLAQKWQPKKSKINLNDVVC